jgi:hypothetical protein
VKPWGGNSPTAHCATWCAAVCCCCWSVPARISLMKPSKPSRCHLRHLPCSPPATEPVSTGLCAMLGMRKAGVRPCTKSRRLESTGYGCERPDPGVSAKNSSCQFLPGIGRLQRAAGANFGNASAYAPMRPLTSALISDT